MTQYLNLNGTSNVASYEISADSIQVDFKSGTYRHYLYDQIHPGKQVVDAMKALAIQGHGLNSYISTTVKKNFAKKW